MLLHMLLHMLLLLLLLLLLHLQHHWWWLQHLVWDLHLSRWLCLWQRWVLPWKAIFSGLGVEGDPDHHRSMTIPMGKMMIVAVGCWGNLETDPCWLANLPPDNNLVKKPLYEGRA